MMSWHRIPHISVWSSYSGRFVIAVQVFLFILPYFVGHNSRVEGFWYFQLAPWIQKIFCVKEKLLLHGTAKRHHHPPSIIFRYSVEDEATSCKKEERGKASSSCSKDSSFYRYFGESSASTPLTCREADEGNLYIAVASSCLIILGLMMDIITWRAQERGREQFGCQLFSLLAYTSAANTEMLLWISWFSCRLTNDWNTRLFHFFWWCLWSSISQNRLFGV